MVETEFSNRAGARLQMIHHPKRPNLPPAQKARRTAGRGSP